MSRFKQTGHGPAGPPPPPRVAPGPKPKVPKDDHPFIGLIVSLIVLAIFVAGLGFFSHMAIDIFDWAWDLWASLVD